MSRSNDLVCQLSFLDCVKLISYYKSWIILTTEYLVFAYQESKCVINK
jgi:hypothetical protein